MKDFFTELLMTVEYIVEKDNPEKNDLIRYGEVTLYWSKSKVNVYVGIGETKEVDHYYYSVFYKGITVRCSEQKILNFDISDPKMWGANLNRWLCDVRMEVVEAINEKAEKKREDIDEAAATGN